MQAGDYQAAIGLFKSSYSLKPTYQTAYYTAYCFNSLNQCDSTAKYCKLAIILDAPVNSVYFDESNKMIDACQSPVSTIAATTITPESGSTPTAANTSASANTTTSANSSATTTTTHETAMFMVIIKRKKDSILHIPNYRIIPDSRVLKMTNYVHAPNIKK